MPADCIAVQTSRMRNETEQSNQNPPDNFVVKSQEFNSFEPSCLIAVQESAQTTESDEQYDDRLKEQDLAACVNFAIQYP